MWCPLINCHVAFIVPFCRSRALHANVDRMDMAIEVHTLSTRIFLWRAMLYSNAYVWEKLNQKSPVEIAYVPIRFKKRFLYIGLTQPLVVFVIFSIFFRFFLLFFALLVSAIVLFWCAQIQKPNLSRMYTPLLLYANLLTLCKADQLFINLFCKLLLTIRNVYDCAVN